MPRLIECPDCGHKEHVDLAMLDQWWENHQCEDKIAVPEPIPEPEPKPVIEKKPKKAAKSKKKKSKKR